MMRITRDSHGDANATTLNVEGRIAAEWVDLLETESRAALSQGKRLILDFSGVVGVDDCARAVLRRLRDDGVQIINQPNLLGLEETDP